MKESKVLLQSIKIAPVADSKQELENLAISKKNKGSKQKVVGELEPFFDYSNVCKAKVLKNPNDPKEGFKEVLVPDSRDWKAFWTKFDKFSYQTAKSYLFNKFTTVEERLETYYEFDELMSSEQIDNQNTRTHIETFQEKCASIAKESIDIESFENLARELFIAIKNRLVIILNLESVPGLLNNAIDCQAKGVSCHSANLAIKAKLNELNRLLSDSNVTEWIKEGNSDMQLYNDPNIYDDPGLVTDYIDTYQKVLRQLSDIRFESLEEFRDAIHNEFDIFEENILSNDLDIECRNYVDIPEDEDYEDYLD